MNLDDILTRKLLALFPDPARRDDAIRALSRYGEEPHEYESIRVRLAILRLSGGDLGKLRNGVATAKRDYRDILAYAEYPRQADHDSWKLTPEQNAELEAEDRRDYERWLTT